MCLRNLTLRDDHDMNRIINPLLQADDAILIDNSESIHSMSKML